MNGKAIHKHFDKLTPRERAALVVNAFGRDDRVEINRLIDAAPRITLDAPDFGRTMMRLADAIRWHAQAQTANAANMFLVMHFEESERYPDVDGAVMVMAFNIITRADSWRLFCAELGLDPGGALKLAGADPLLLEWAEEVARAVNPDVATLREKLRVVVSDNQAELKTAEQVAAEYRALLNVAKSSPT